MQCSKCHQDAIIFQPYSGLHLCSKHVVSDVEAKAKKVIRAQGWLRPGDHIAVLLADDINSRALLYFLKQLTKQRRDIRISAITITDGTNTTCNISHATHITNELDIELIVVSLPEKSDMTAKTDSQETSVSASLPSFYSTGIILPDHFAHQHGISKIAWGLCLDDAAEVVLESVIRGDAEKLVSHNSCHQELVRICPFISVTAAEVSLYADIHGLGNEHTVPPSTGNGLHQDTIELLETYTKNHPATKYALLNLGENLVGSQKGIAALINTCERLGTYPFGHFDSLPIMEG